MLLLLSSSVAVLAPFGMKTALDALPALDAARFLTGLCFWAGGFCLTGSVAGLGAKLRTSIIEELVLNQRKNLMAKAISLPLAEADRMPRGDVVSRMTADVNESSRLFTNLYFLVDIILRAVTASVYMVILSWQVGLVTVAGSACVVLIARWSNAAVPSKTKTYQAALGGVSSLALNILEGRVVLKAFLAERRMTRSFDEEAGVASDSGIRLAKHVSGATFLSMLGAFLPLAGALAYGGYMVTAGELSFGGILALLHLSDYIGPLAGTGRQLAEFQKSRGALERVRELLDLESESEAPEHACLVDPAGDRTAAAGEPAIRVRDLRFEYDRGRPVLQGVSLDIPRGARVAVMGKSGSGKSTLLKILAGLYPATSGAVEINGANVSDGFPQRTRSEVTYAPQEAFLFPGSVRQNLEIARQDAAEGDLEAALLWADAAEVVRGLPDGIDTQVGERGSSLSGGQRQRLALARTVLRGTPVVLLDEPTSALDPEAEARVIERLLTLRDITWVVITHRFPLAEVCDTVLVMDGGMIVEAGDHSSLLERRGLYWRLYTGEASFSSPGDGREQP